ncbi:class I SAM-dependent methyltransferase [Leucothrix mucor]|uniref:class I SAM-dependent methyltransferase n=1 Tax=Leucothrix mucor TaxID=45248 RepID=UPI0003B5A817|nr:class I SAM-dependent methyltransferase [Leucothrix mucor]
MYFQQSRPEMCAFLPESYTRVLEIGCGEGTFSKNLDSGQVVELWGIEPSKDAGSVAETQAYKVLYGTYEDCFDLLPDNFFDLVVCNDVIEHMVDHDHFFSSIKKKMQKKGFITGSIPNVRYYRNLKSLLLKKDWQYQNSGVLDRTHLRFFTEKSLLRTFKEHDYVISSFSGINKARGFKLFIILALVFSFFSWKDIQYTQFGFRISPK